MTSTDTTRTAWVWECVPQRHRWVSTRHHLRCPECRTVRVMTIREATDQATGQAR